MEKRIFEGQTVCVIGGTAGIGLSIAKRAQLEGANVIVAGRDLGRARSAAENIGSGVVGKAIDILDEKSIATFFESLGPVDHLVLTAAQVRGGPFKTGAIENARHSVLGKFWAQYLCARHAEVRCSIIFFSGTLSRKPMVGTSIIGAVNGAIEALGRSLAVELAPVRVNVLSPGLIQGTEAYAGMPSEARNGMIAAATQRLPARLVGDGDSVAVLACAVMASPYMTGTTIDVDGGGLVT